MLAFVSHVLIMSAHNPIERIRKICLKESGNPVTIKNAGRTAASAVKVIKIPVLNAPKILEFTEPSFDLMALEVKSMSVSTEYPINIKNAAIPAADILIPSISTIAKGIATSANTAKITAMLGIKVLKRIKITIDIKTKEISNAVISCL